MSLERVVRWNNVYAGKRRKGEHCTILSERDGTAQVRFDDGQTAIVDRRALTSSGGTKAYRTASSLPQYDRRRPSRPKD